MIGKTTRILMCLGGACLMAFASGAYGASVNQVILAEAGGLSPADVGLEDNDKSVVIDYDGDGLMGLNDVLRGMFEVQSIDGPLPGNTSIGAGSVNNELTAVFDIMVIQALAPGHPNNPVPSEYYWTFGADPAFGTYAGDAVLPPVPGGAMIMAFDDAAQDYVDDAVVPGQEPWLMQTAINGSLWGAFGLVRAGDYWYTTAPTNVIAVISSSIAPGFGIGAMADMGFVTSLIPTGGLADNLLVPNATGSELSGSGGIYGRHDPNGVPVSINFDFISDTDLTIRVVPTPMAIWAAMPLLGLGAFILKRRVR